MEASRLSFCCGSLTGEPPGAGRHVESLGPQASSPTNRSARQPVGADRCVGP